MGYREVIIPFHGMVVPAADEDGSDKDAIRMSSKHLESGVSEVYGTILLVSLIVLAFSIVTIAVLSQPHPEQVPRITAKIENVTIEIDPATKMNRVFITHAGGDILKNGQYLLFINNGDRTSRITAVYGDDGNTEWNAGETLVLDLGSDVPYLVQIFYQGAGNSGLLVEHRLSPAPVVPVPSPGNYYSIVSSSGAGGVINPLGTIYVPSGGNQMYLMTPDPGYHGTDVIVNGIPVGPVSRYNFSNVLSSQQIFASFAINTYTIHATAGPNGNITPAGDTTVPYGSKPTFTIMPDTGYHVADVLVNNASVGAVTSYTFPPISANQSISAIFMENGPLSIVQLLPPSVIAGSNGFTLTVNGSGFAPSSIIIWGGVPLLTTRISSTEVTAWIPESYVASAGSVNVTVSNPPEGMTSNSATFTIIPRTFTVSPSVSGGNGTIRPGTPVTVMYNGTPTFTFTPNTGYHLDTVTVDGSQVTPAGNSYTFPPVTANHSIVATFAITSFTITATSGANGVITPASITSVTYGATPTYTIQPDAGYHVADVLVNGTSVGPVTSYTFPAVTSDMTISATFAISTYTITASAGAGGSISPSGIINVSYGGSQAFTILPGTGYLVADVLVDDVPQGAITSYTFTNVTANHTISATFTTTMYTITASTGTGGSISPSGSVSVPHGGSQAFTITPATGHSVSSVLVDGISQGAVSSYTFTNVDSDHTIFATFITNSYTITASAGTGGSISPSGSVSVLYGGSKAFTITPATGHVVSSVSVDGIPQGVITSYTFTNVVTDHTISASFTLMLYTITASTGTGGSISPSGTVSVSYGGSQAFTISPNSGFAVSNVIVDGVSKGPMGAYTFTSVASNHTISATFAIFNYTITATAGTGGSISPSGVVGVNAGGSQTFTISPDPGHVIQDVVVDGVSKGAITSYTFSNVVANHAIMASFTPVIYTITASAGSGGSISPSGTIKVNGGSSQAFSITPNSGYYVSNVVVDGVSQGSLTSYTFSNVIANHVISASFAPLISTITASAGTGGTITPSGPVFVNYGGSQAFTISPSIGYVISDVLVDGVSKGAVTSYSFTGVVANHTISAIFLEKKYIITVTWHPPGQAGEVSASPPSIQQVWGTGYGTVTVPAGGDVTINFNVKGQKNIVNALYDNNPVSGPFPVKSWSFIITNVRSNHTLDATIV